MSEPTYQTLFDCLLRITGKAFTEDEMSEIKGVCNSEVETLLKEEREKFRLRTLQYSAAQEQLQQKEDEISILADLVKGRDLTIQQKDAEIERLTSASDRNAYQCLSEMDLKEAAEDKLTSYRELMGQRENKLFSFLKSLHEGSGFLNEYYVREEAGELLKEYHKGEVDVEEYWINIHSAFVSSMKIDPSSSDKEGIYSHLQKAFYWFKENLQSRAEMDVEKLREFSKEWAKTFPAHERLLAESAHLSGQIRIAGLQPRAESEAVIKKLNEAFLPKNIECDGPGCIGCWKDVIREAISMLQKVNTPSS